MKDWVVVYRSSINSRTEIVKGVLNSQGIEAVIVNKKDSMIALSKGDIEVMVPRSKVLKAMKIVNDEIAFK